MFRSPVKWSPVEIEYLKNNIDTVSIDQLCIALNKSRNAIQKKVKELSGVEVKSKASRYQSKIGYREDLGIFVRSGWEANFLRLVRGKFLKFKDPLYEPRTFSFTEWVPPKGPSLSYTPDFVVTKNKRTFFVEVKGNWLRAADKTKLRRFKKYYPDEFDRLIVVCSSLNSSTAKFFLELGVKEKNIIEYNKLKQEYSKKVTNWE